MKRIFFYITLVSIIIGQLSCEKFEVKKNADVFFHVKVNQTELPVWVKGNTASNKLLIYINGGPGLTSIDVAHIDMFEWSDILENDFAVVYYDQRGCGNAQGNIQGDNLTVNQFALDLDAIINILSTKYADAEIFLMAHSFGSFIAANYLMDTVKQAKVSGWVSVDGAFNFDYDLQWDYRRKFLLNIANEEIASNNDVSHWTEAIQWINNNPIISTSDQKDEWRQFIGEPGQRIIPMEEADIKFRNILSIGFLSSYNPLPAYMSKNLEIVNDSLNADAEGKNIISEVGIIKIPSLFIWGRYDDLIPPELGQDVFNNLGNSTTSKHFITMPNSSHEPFLSYPKDFQISVSHFIGDI